MFGGIRKTRDVTKNSPKSIVEVVTFVKRLYPKGVVKNGDWQVVVVHNKECREDFVITGNMLAMDDFQDYEAQYKIVANLEWNEKRSEWGYVVKFSQEVYEFKSIDDQKIFLGTFLTDTQLNNIFNMYDNPIKVIEEQGVEALVKVKGIGAKTADKIVDKYMGCKDKSKAYVELCGLGLSTNVVDKLVSRYKSPEAAIEKVKENPYTLVKDVRGIGFRKADEIAMQMGFSTDNPNRCVAFAYHFFNNKADSGDCYTEYDEFLKELDNTLGVDYPDESIDKAMKLLNDKEELWFKDCVDDDGYEYTLLGLRKYYDIEKEICHHLNRLINAENKTIMDKEVAMQHIKEQEERQGWKFTERQLEGIFTCMNNNVTIITGYGGCVDCDTEYFNGAEWKRIADYIEGEQVLQYNKDGSAELVYPSKYVKLPEDTLWHFSTKYGTDQCLSLGHRVVYRTSKGNLHIKPFDQVMLDHLNCKSGFTGKFYTTFDYNGTGIDLTDSQIRLQVAVIADGHIKGDTTWCKMRLKKERKQARLEMLLNEADIDYTKKFEESTGFTIYSFYAPTKEKEFSSRWYNCTKEQFEVVCDEVLHWDGSTAHKDSFYTTSKCSADFIQFAFATVGKRCNMQIDNRVGQIITGHEEDGYTHKSLGYYFTPTTRNMVGIGGFHEGQTKTPIRPYKTKDGYQYCFAVPSTMLVLRRNGKIFITGNTGKTSAVSGMLSCMDDNYTFEQCALSGKASVNLTDVTGKEGKTIHSLLGYVQERNDVKFNEENPLETDLVILDEASMVEIELALQLLRAIPNGAKLIMLGDTAQLEAIGAGNFLMDMIESGKIPTVVFDKVHRQGAKSAIKTDSINVAQGQRIVKSGWQGVEVRGELQDFKLIGFNHDKSSNTKRPSIDLIMAEFKEVFKKVSNIEDIVVALPTKANGTGCLPVNRLIQDYVLPKRRGMGVTIGEGKDEFSIYVGDKVINLKNNRKTYNIEETFNEFGEKVIDKVVRPIYNGNVGEVVEVIDETSVVVDFYNIGKVIVKDQQLQQLALGYAITVHKLQGSTIPYVIGCVDYSHFTMLNKQLVYTLMSRAKNELRFIFETNALLKAISTNNVSTKRTFLYHFLCGELE